MVQIEFEKYRNRSVAYDGSEMVGEMTFVPAPTYWTIDHTYVNPNYRGQQIAQKLMEKLMDAAAEDHMKVVPVCSFAKRECEANPSFAARVFREGDEG